MLGNTFWADLEIDAYENEIVLKKVAEDLVDHWGKDLTETDLLKLNAHVHAEANGVENIIAAYALEYYLTKDYKPQFIHHYESKQKNPWWKFWKKSS